MVLREVGEAGRPRAGPRRAPLPMPEQEVAETPDGDGGFTLSFRPAVEAEDWNAQISLLTGMGAAELMLDGRIGILRTMPPPDDRAVRRSTARPRPWVCRGRRSCATAPSADPRPDGPEAPGPHPRGDLALPRGRLHAVRGCRAGAAAARRRRQPVCARHRAAAPARRPLRPRRLRGARPGSRGARLGADRAAELPDLMGASDRTARAVERACTDAVEAAVLLGHVGTTLRPSSSTSPTRVSSSSSSSCRCSRGSPATAAALGSTVTVGSSRPTSRRSAVRLVRRPLDSRADESGGRSRRWATTAEEGPGSEGQDGGQQPPGVTRGTVPQRTDRRRPRERAGQG